MSRYLERAESVARFVDVNINLMLDLAGSVPEQWAPLVSTTGDQPDFLSRYAPGYDRHDVIQFLTFDDANPNSILSCLRSARENARSVREIIPTPVFEELNKFYLWVSDVGRRGRALDATFDFFQLVKRSAQLIVGVEEVTMSRGEAWHFSRLGRYLERADKTSRILDVKYYLLLPTPSHVGSSLDVIQWSALLKSTNALEMYRKRWGRITSQNVVDFLLLDLDFPRALRFCLNQAEESLRAITASTPGDYRNPALRRLGQLRSELDYAQVREIIEGGLHEFIDKFQTRLNRAGIAVQEVFFATPAALQDGRLAGSNA